jgi:putative ABC transport system ATP-binding protein
MIRLTDVTKIYRTGTVEVAALAGVSLDIADGEWVAVMGPSGCGKSTLMHVIGCLDTPTSGSYQLDGTEVTELGDDALAVLRNQRIGFVFQSFNLLPRTPALQQVLLPLQYRLNGDRTSAAEQRARAEAALVQVGLKERMDHRPGELSGGQAQRVAIARALVTQPRILLADEPTGNLDSKSGREIRDLFHVLHEQHGLTLVTVTHDEEIGAEAERVIRLRDGRIVSGGER